jgi:hypothetical protein
MINHNKYHYKSYDVESNSRREKLQMEIMNPYGYNFDSNKKRELNLDTYDKTTQDYIVIQKKDNLKS